MLTAWRLVKTRHVATAWDGEGAAATGGRWNSPGVPVIYASATLSLSLLEILVHLPSGLMPSYKAMSVQFDESLVTTLPASAVPANFQSYPVPPETRAVGDAWVASGRSAVLSVPSVIVPMERNYVFHPGHRDFRKLRIGAAQAFPLDRRLAAK
jgi:RES domain-containing protein